MALLQSPPAQTSFTARRSAASCSERVAFGSVGLSDKQHDAAPRGYYRCRQHCPRAPLRCTAAPPDYDVPELEEDLRAVQAASGATFTEGDVPASFGNAGTLSQAQEQGCVLADLSNWGRLRVSGRDALQFLHQQSSADFLSLQPGQGCMTVFMNSQGRATALATCYVLSRQSVLMTTCPEAGSFLQQHLEKYILYGDEVSVKDASQQCAMFALLGRGSEQLLRGMGALLPDPPSVPSTSHQGASQPSSEHSCGMQQFQGQPLLAARGAGLGSGALRQGWTLIPDDSIAADAWQTLSSKGAVPMGSHDWELQRIQAGRPRFGSELNGNFTPFEAGLWGEVSLAKGCYMGQETLAKVYNLNATRRRLAGLRMSTAAAVGTPVMLGGQNLGGLTSVAETPEGGWAGLAYLRCKEGRGSALRDLEGLQVTVDGSLATVKGLDFARWDLRPGSGPQQQQPESIRQAPSAADVRSAAADAPVLDEKAKKLQQMQERLVAWQQQQAQQQQQ